LHLSPAAAPAGEIDEGDRPQKADQLAVAEVLEEGEDDHAPDVARAGVTAKAELLEGERGHGENDAEENGQREEREEERDRRTS